MDQEERARLVAELRQRVLELEALDLLEKTKGTNPPAGSRVQESCTLEQISLLDAPLITLDEGDLPSPLISAPLPGASTLPPPIPPRRRNERFVESRVPMSSDAERVMAIRMAIYRMPPEELLPAMWANRINTKGQIEDLVDRFTRFEIRRQVGNDWAVWDDERDMVGPRPNIQLAGRDTANELIDVTPEDVRQVRSPVRNDTSGFSNPPSPSRDCPVQDTNNHIHDITHNTQHAHTSTQDNRSTNNRNTTHSRDTNRETTQARLINVSETDLFGEESWGGEIQETWPRRTMDGWTRVNEGRRGGLPTGQSEGRYRDPISLDPEPSELTSRSGRVAVYAEETIPRRSLVTFADAPVIVHQIRSSTPTPELTRRQETLPQTDQLIGRNNTNPFLHDTAVFSEPYPGVTTSDQNQPSLNPPVPQIPQVPQIPPVLQQKPPENPSSNLPIAYDQAPRNPPMNPSVFQHQLPEIPPSDFPDNSRLPLRTHTERPNTQDHRTDQTSRRQITLYSDSSEQRLPNTTYLVTNPASTQTSTPDHSESQHHYHHCEGVPHDEPGDAGVGRGDLTVGFVPFGSGVGERTRPYSDRVGRCGTYLRAGNVRFNGVDGDADEFLRQVKEASEIYALTSEESMNVLPYVLEGPALAWFRAERRDWKQYRQFVQSFRLCYSSLGLDARVWDEIRGRTQGMNELLGPYLTSLRILFSHLSCPVPVSKQLDIAFANLNPKYMAVMNRKEVGTMEEFRIKGREYEDRLRRMANYVPPKGPEKSLVPAAAYIGKSRRSDRVTATKHTGECYVDATSVSHTQPSPQKPKRKVSDACTQTTPPPLGDIPPRRIAKCYSCGQPGHFKRECPNVRMASRSGNEKGSQ